MAVAFSNAGAHVGDGRINFIFAVITANVETVDATAGPVRESDILRLNGGDYPNLRPPGDMIQPGHNETLRSIDIKLVAQYLI